jgi:phage gp29-like protein
VRFKEMAVWCDEQISKAVLGQTMTTDNGSSRSQADVHDRVRMDIARWDARQLENTLNEFLVRPFIIMNYGPQDAYPRVVLRLSEPEDLKMLVDALIPLIDRGMEVQMSEVRDKFGLSEPEKGAAMLVPSSQALQPALAMNRERVALNRSQWDDIDLMVTMPCVTGSVPAMRSPVRFCNWRVRLTASRHSSRSAGTSENA